MSFAPFVVGDVAAKGLRPPAEPRLVPQRVKQFQTSHLMMSDYSGFCEMFQLRVHAPMHGGRDQLRRIPRDSLTGLKTRKFLINLTQGLPLVPCAAYHLVHSFP
jgi:hypothetical protein